MIIIDAKHMVAGRIGTFAAKQALQGEEIAIINSELAVISGTRERVLEHWKNKYARGVPRKGPFVSRMPDRFLRRLIRGMVPHHQPRGREAFKRIMCYIGAPKIDGKVVKLEGASAEKLPGKYITIGQVCTALGGKHEER